MRTFAALALSSYLLACGVFTKEVKVPVAPEPCVIPAFHVQQPCADDIECLLGEFALTVQAENSVKVALKACPNISVR